MSANEIANQLAAMVVFQPAASQGAVTHGRAVGVDQTVLTSNLGITRTGTGRYTVSLIDKIPGGASLQVGAVGGGSVAAGFILSVGVDSNGDMTVAVNTDAGAASDSPLVTAILHRFPTVS
jgi:hypothetical protein